MNQILISPLITEKSMREAQIGRFTFIVAVEANKNQISQAVASAFKVKPVKVQTITIKGTSKRSARSPRIFKTSIFKKAIVTLSKGEKIDLFDVTEKEHQHA